MNNKEEVAVIVHPDREMLQLLAASLPAFRKEASEAYQMGDFVTLKRVLHKMHGGLYYTNTPALLLAVKAFHDALNENRRTGIDGLYQAMFSALDRFEKALESVTYES